MLHQKDEINSFQGVNRVFVLSFENEGDRKAQDFIFQK